MNRRITAIISKVILWILGIIIAQMIVVQLLLTPRVLTPIIERYATHYIDVDVRFQQVSVNVLRYFPNITVTIDSCLFSYSSDRFSDCISNPRIKNASMRGSSRDSSTCSSDTLAAMNAFRAAINPFSLLHNKLRIKHISITDLTGFAHRYDSTHVNWDILKNIDDPGDTAESKHSGELPVPSIGRITLNGHLGVVFTDELTGTVLLAKFSSFDFKGNRDSNKELLRDFRLKMDSLLVFRSVTDNSEALSIEKIRLMSTGQTGIEGELEANLLSSSIRHGRIELPVDIAFKADIPSTNLDTIRVNSMEGDICGLPFLFKGDVCFPGDSLYVDASLDIHDGDIGNISEKYGVLLLDFLKRIKTDAVTNIHAQAKGFYSSDSGTLPHFSVSVDIPESSILIDRTDTARFHLNCRADNLDRGRVNLSIDTVAVSAFGSTRISLSGKLTDMLSSDPSVTVDMNASADLSPWSYRLGTDTTFRFSGRFEGMVKGDAKLSQLKLPDIWEADLDARLRASGLWFSIPSDSIDIYSDTVKFILGAKTNEFIPELEKGNRMLSALTALDTAFIRYKDRFEGSLNNLRIMFHNNASPISNRGNASKKNTPQCFADISADRLSLMDSDSSKIILRDTKNTIKLGRQEKNDSIPTLSLTSTNKFIAYEGRSGRVSILDLNLNFNAEKRTTGERPKGGQNISGRPAHTKDAAPNDFSSSDIHFSLGESFKKMYREWMANGNASFRKARITTPMFPTKNNISRFGISFSNNFLSIDSLNLKSGETQVNLHGRISGLKKSLLYHGTAVADFSLNTPKMDINELMAALAVGSAAKAETIVTEESGHDISTEEILSTAEDMKSPLIVIPGNVKATINMSGKDISVSKMVIDSLSTVIEMQDRCLKVSHITAGTNVGKLTFEGFYATKSKKDISLGFNLGLSKITAGEVISMLPQVDTIMPLLKSFDGELRCYIAGTAKMDTNMNIIPPTMKGVLRLGGDNLRIDQSPNIKKVTRLLMFKNKTDFNIETMSVEAQLYDSRIEVFPFLLKVDRYVIASSGIQNLDQSCKYHISVIKSPLPFRLGLDISGDNFDKLHYKLVRPKYRSEEKIPSFSSTIDDTRLNLSNMISNIFAIGVDKARNDSTFIDNIEKRKNDISYVAAQDSESEALSESEVSKMKIEAEKSEEK